MKTALITGITGQDGSYLAEFLLKQNYRVVGMTRPGVVPNLANLGHIQAELQFAPGDLLDQDSMHRLLEQHQPDEIYNLAADSFGPASWDHPLATGDSMGLGVTRILEAMRKVAPKARLFQASSSEMFGRAVVSPQNEATPLCPRIPYGAAKVYAHWMIASYRQRYGLFACSGILYNHESPRRAVSFVTRKITHGAARIKLGLSRELSLGNLDARRDWGFAGDYVEAMWRMLQHPEPEDFIVATGVLHSVREFCEVAFRSLGLDYREFVVQDPRFSRSDDYVPLGDASKARRLLGWQPTMTFPDLIHTMVDSDIRLFSRTQAS